MSTAVATVATASAMARGWVLGIWGGQCHGEGQWFGATPEPMAMVGHGQGQGPEIKSTGPRSGPVPRVHEDST